MVRIRNRLLKSGSLVDGPQLLLYIHISLDIADARANEPERLCHLVEVPARIITADRNDVAGSACMMYCMYSTSPVHVAFKLNKRRVEDARTRTFRGEMVQLVCAQALSAWEKPRSLFCCEVFEKLQIGWA